MKKDKSICTFVSTYSTHTKSSKSLEEVLQKTRTTQDETTYLLKSETMKQRLLAAKARKDNVGETLLLTMPNVGESEDFARRQDLGQKHERLLSFLKKHRVKVDCILIPNREERNRR